MEKITPKVDIAFKKIFGVEENKDLLIALINSIVTEEDQVADVTILNPYNPQNFQNDKLSILDVKALSKEGKKFNIEIQLFNPSDYDKRALFYWGKLYTESLQTGQGYSSLTKTIGIHILDFNQIPQAKKYHNVFRIVEKDDRFFHFEDLELHTIELKKFTSDKEELSDIVNKVQTSLDAWATFLARNDLLEANKLPQGLDDPNIKKALKVLEVMNFNEEERSRYEDELKYTRDKEGGLKQAKLEGKVEGKIEEKIAMAKVMLADDQPIEKIMKYTGLSEKDLKKLN